MDTNQYSIKAIRTRIYVAFASIFFLIGMATVLFKYLENWTWIDSFYFVVSTSATVGYGDITPASEIGRLIVAIYIMVMVPIVIYSFTKLAEIYFERRVVKKTQKNDNNQKSE